MKVNSRVQDNEKWQIFNTLKGVCLKNVQYGTYIRSAWGNYETTGGTSNSQMMMMTNGCSPYETFKLMRASVVTYIDIKFDILHATSQAGPPEAMSTSFLDNSLGVDTQSVTQSVSSSKS